MEITLPSSLSVFVPSYLFLSPPLDELKRHSFLHKKIIRPKVT